MRTRMAADLVSSAPQLADAGRVEKSARADVVDRYEKMAAKPVTLERVSRAECADASIVEREDEEGARDI